MSETAHRESAVETSKEAYTKTPQSTGLVPVQSNGEGASSTLEAVELKERFGVVSSIGVQFSIIGTPLAIGSYLSFIVGVGGSPYFFYGYVVAITFQLITCLSVAEIASVFPHTSGKPAAASRVSHVCQDANAHEGQMFWTSSLAPPASRRFLSYFVGACSTTSWIFATAGSFVLTGQVFLSSVMITRQTFNGELFQTWLAAVAVAVVSILFNTTFIRAMPLILSGAVYFLVAASVFILVALLVRTNPKASAATVFADVVNETGWSSNGLVFMLCLLPGSVGVSAFDCSTHLTDELPRPHRQVPQIMICTAVLSALSGLIMVLVYLFCATNPMALMEPIGGQPIFQVFHDAFRSDALLITALSIYCIEYVIACIALITTASRVTWTFAKHGGLPYGELLGRVSGEDLVPRNAVVFTTIVGAAISALVFGPHAILNAMYGATAITTSITFAIPITLLLMDKRRALSKSRYVNLGKAGVVLNVITLCWLLVLVTFLSFPLYIPVTAANMNYAIPAAAIAILLALVNWVLFARKNFVRPHALFIEGFTNIT